MEGRKEGGRERRREGGREGGGGREREGGREGGRDGGREGGREGVAWNWCIIGNRAKPGNQLVHIMVV